jgi:hypothetical protein
MNIPRLLINDSLIHKEQMHCVDASYPKHIIKVRFIYSKDEPLHNLKKDESYFIGMTNVVNQLNLGFYKLVKITHINDGPIKFKTYHFQK